MRTERIDTRNKRKLALRRETLRALDSLTPEQLALAAGGDRLGHLGISLSAGTKFC